MVCRYRLRNVSKFPNCVLYGGNLAVHCSLKPTYGLILDRQLSLQGYSIKHNYEHEATSIDHQACMFRLFLQQLVGPDAAFPCQAITTETMMPTPPSKEHLASLDFFCHKG